MADGKLSEHALETYKGLIQLGQSAINLIVLLNGGAAVALLAFLGNAKMSPLPDMRPAMFCYLLGLTMAGLTMVGAYLMQLRLFNEEVGRKAPVSHEWFLRACIAVALLSVVAFAAGSISAVMAFPA